VSVVTENRTGIILTRGLRELPRRHLDPVRSAVLQLVDQVDIVMIGLLKS
jgi:hypothetical protein